MEWKQRFKGHHCKMRGISSFLANAKYNWEVLGIGIGQVCEGVGKFYWFLSHGWIMVFSFKNEGILTISSRRTMIAMPLRRIGMSGLLAIQFGNELFPMRNVKVCQGLFKNCQSKLSKMR